MKRILYLAMAALMVLAVSCKKDPKDPIDPDDDNTFPVPEAVDLEIDNNSRGSGFLIRPVYED